jgi:hypothetical protein
MGYFTRDQIVQKINSISAAIDAVMDGQTYSIDTGQGRMSVTKASLSGLREQLDYWDNKLDELDSPGSGIVSVRVGR